MDDDSKYKEVIDQLGISMTTVFIPWSESRNYKENPKPLDYSLNWKVTIRVKGNPILTTDYSMGIAGCPSYPKNHYLSVMDFDLIKTECETGRKAHYFNGINYTGSTKVAIEPPILDVLYAICLDSDAINYSSFEEWASSFGYSTDSKSAESIYKNCLEIGLKFMNGLGKINFDKLQDAMRDY